MERARGITFADVIVALATIALTAALLFPVFAQTNIDRADPCQSNVKQLVLGALMYAGDWDNVLPPARVWGDTTMPYVRSMAVFRCPDLDSRRRDQYGYAFDKAAGGSKLNRISQLDKQRVLFDSNDLSWNANGGASIFLSDVARHGGRVHVAYADGHLSRSSRKQIFEAFRSSRGVP